MKGPVAGRTSQAFAEQQNTVGNPHFPTHDRLFDPVFAPSTSALLKVISDEVAKFQEFVLTPTAVSMRGACEGARALKELMTQVDVASLDTGREAFRRKFSLTILDQVIELGGCDTHTTLLRGILTEDYTGASKNLCEALTAGISDYNDKLKSLRRRAYSQDGGGCDELARQLRDVALALDDVKAEQGRATPEKSDGSVHGRGILEKLAPIVAQAKDLFELIPQQRAVCGSFAEHCATAKMRIADFHLPDAKKAVMCMAGDMIECKHALQIVEGLVPKMPRGRPSRR